MDPDSNPTKAKKMAFAAAETRVHNTRQGSAAGLFSAFAAGASIGMKYARGGRACNPKVIRFRLVLPAFRWQQVAVATGRHP
jgi:hypothetical protein